MEQSLKTVAIVQARMGSTRLPGKVMKQIGQNTIIGLLLKRLSLSKRIDKIVLATSIEENNNPLVEHVSEMGFAFEQGSEDDVLERFYCAAKSHDADVIVRITGDCPFVDAELVDQTIDVFQSSSSDYVSNSNPPSFPDGLDVEIFSIAALKKAHLEATSVYDREHVTPYLRNNDQFKVDSVQGSVNFAKLRWTLDEPEDFHVIKSVFDHFKPNIYFSWIDILALQKSNPNLFEINQNITRNEGVSMGKGQKLYKRAKRVIPGGNMLLSKRPEMFLPEQWPAYFSKASGCRVWDLDGHEYIDMSIMGIGTNTLGYGNTEVDAAVKESVANGNMSTFNCPEEVYLAERLVELHPWADMVRFCRSGGEANAVAIRIARAASGKDKVAICGYHGWHDWYLAANLVTTETLEGHLLPGLNPAGVPKNLTDTVFPFTYNKFDELEILVQKHDIGIIKMEVSRNLGPQDDFLLKVRKLASDRGIVLIFDECTSGFRETFGGLHKKYGVVPDMAMFGKALGNGYAITAVLGKREIMEAAQNTFISSTFWTERIGPSAALKTLDIMEQTKSWEIITSTGLVIRDGLQMLANNYGLKINQWGMLALTGYTFESKNSLAYKTLVTQEMLKKGFLASNSVYVCTAHTPAIVDSFLSALDPIFSQIKECEEGKNIEALLEGPVCHSGFARLN